MNKETGKTYIAITHEQHPLTGEAMPLVRRINRDTTIGELIDWCKGMSHCKVLYDLRITEPV